MQQEHALPEFARQGSTDQVGIVLQTVFRCTDDGE
jgi:hypothetical protein